MSKLETADQPNPLPGPDAATQPNAAASAAAKAGVSRLNIVLLALLLIQVVLIAVTYWPAPASQANDALLLAGMQAADVDRIALTGVDGVEVELVRGGDGWLLPNLDDYPALGDKVEETLTKLLAIETDRLVTRTRESHARLKVAEQAFERKVSLHGGDGIEKSIYIGTSAGAGATHVRLEGSDETYLTSEIAAWELNAPIANWVELLYVSLPAADLVAVELSNANGDLSFQRDENGDWQLDGLSEGEALAADRISSLLTQVATVRMTEPVGRTEQPDYGMEAPQATLVLTTRNAAGGEESVTLLVGAEVDERDEESDHLFKSSASPYFVTIPGYTAKGFIDKTRADYLVEESASGDVESDDPFPSLSSD
ncbi:MAG: DUF4340 domain-containing protein [Caldilineaceae bacterium]|nr:DUF4340 domain-containing protein [Caldilineaceae bacterium]